MLTGKMVESINEQINKEIYSAYLYLGMASYAASISLNGFANWFTVQVQEELSHAQKMYDYVNQTEGRVMLKAIDQPPQDFSSATDLFAKTLEHEKMVTGLINDLVSVAQGEKDKDTETFLRWYVSEQVEEEENAAEILQKLKLSGTDDNGILAIDSELAQRAYTPPSA